MKELTGHGNLVIGVDRQYYESHFIWDNTQENVSFIQADAHQLPFVDHSVDLVTIGAVVGHLNVNSIQNILTEAVRVLKPGVVIEPSTCWGRSEVEMLILPPDHASRD